MNPSDSSYHIPVLGEKVAELLVTDRNGIYIDLTVGGGGHSRFIAEKLSDQAKLIAFDQDREAINEAKKHLPNSTSFYLAAFSQAGILLEKNYLAKIHGILMDLGVSSHQIDSAKRGFSYRQDGPLDLRMDPQHGQSAAELISSLELKELIEIIRFYGEDSQALRIAKAIVSARSHQPISTTFDLANVITKAVPATSHKSLPRVFQALRIAVNHELEELEQGLLASWNLLANGGRLAVLSYHSLEDRIVKNFMREKTHPPSESNHPALFNQPSPTGRLLHNKHIIPDAEEIHQNPRARSAKLRTIEKIV